MKLCDYGCGQKATHIFKNGKACCNSSISKCPEQIRKNKEGQKRRFPDKNKIRVCERCGNEHDGTFGSGRFCGWTCSNTRTHSEETKNKIRIKILNNPKCKENLKIIKRNISDEQKIKISQRAIDRMLSENFNSLSRGLKRKRVILEQNNKCKICEIDSWNGKYISLHLHHIDGNKNNDSRENLIALCPNCHSQTETYCGRNGSNHNRK